MIIVSLLIHFLKVRWLIYCLVAPSNTQEELLPQAKEVRVKREIDNSGGWSKLDLSRDWLLIRDLVIPSLAYELPSPTNPFFDDPESPYEPYEDKTEWCHYEHIFRNKNGEHDGTCRWSAPPPVPLGNNKIPISDVFIQDEKTMKFHPLPQGMKAPQSLQFDLFDDFWRERAGSYFFWPYL